MRASMVDLRRRMRDVLKALRRNESVTLTYRGKVIGTIQPASANGKKQDVRKDPAFGMWADREDMKDPSEWVRKLRSRRKERLRSIWNQPLPDEKRKRAV